MSTATAPPPQSRVVQQAEPAPAPAPPPQQPPAEGDADFKRLMSARFNDKELKAIERIDQVTRECRGVMERAADHMARALMMADGIATLRALITSDIMQKILPLMNTRLGFRTDKDPHRPRFNKKTGQYDEVKAYPEAVVKECFIESLLYGAYPIGNEWNIIASNLYLTKEFFIRKVGELPGVTDVVASPGVPTILNGKTVIRYGLSWKKEGTKDSLKDAEGKPGRVFEIKTDDYSSADQIVGKADRKAFAAAYRQITGSQITLPEGDTDDVVDVTGQVRAGNGNRSAGIGASMNGTPAAPHAPADPHTQPPAPTDDSQLPEEEQKRRAEARTTSTPMSDEEANRIIEEKARLAQQKRNEEEKKDPDDALLKSPWAALYNTLIDIARTAYKINKRDAEGGVFKYQQGHGGAQMNLEDRRALLNAVRNNQFDYATGTIKPA